MPELTVNGATLHYEDSGEGPETIVFAHGLLWDHRMFDAQVAALEDRYRCIRFDFRGQGQSEVTSDGYDMDTLTCDALALIEALDCAPVHFAGLSMGGFVGMRLAIRHPDLIRSLILMETTADTEPEENRGKYRKLNFIARWFGLRPVAGKVMPIMFGQTFLNDADRIEERERMKQRMIGNHRKGITRATSGVINRQGVYDQLPEIKAPTLILVGDEDTATVPEKSERMHARIPQSKLVIIPGAGHSSSIEQPDAVTDQINQFLDSQC